MRERATCRYQVQCSERSEYPGNNGEDCTQNEIDTNHAADGAHQGIVLPQTALAGDMLYVGVAEAGGDDAAHTDSGGDHSPDAVLRGAHVAEDDGSNQQHADGIGSVIQHAIGRIC